MQYNDSNRRNKMKFYSGICMGLLALATAVGAQELPRRVFELNAGPDNPRNSEGTFVALKDGRLMFAYSHFTGTSGSDYGHANISVRYSADKGETWSGPRMIVKQEGNMNVMSVSLLRLQDGRIALFYLRKNSEVDCRPLMRVSTDEGETWNDPVEILGDKIGYYELVNDRTIQLKSGRILLPMDVLSRPNDSTIGKGKVFSAMSDDGGKTWHTGQEYNARDADGNPVLLEEPGAVELNDGRILMYIRTDIGCQYITHSADAGETWETPHPSTFLLGPMAPTSMKRLKNGDLLVVWNDHTGLPKAWKERPNPKNWAVVAQRKNHHSYHVDRTPLTTAISQDDGKTWKFIKNLEGNPNGWYCYTSIHVMDDCVLLSYVRDCNLYNDRMTKVPLSWLYDPTPRQAYVMSEPSAFQDVKEGEFSALPTAFGTWSVTSGRAEIFKYPRGKGVHLFTDGAEACVELALPTPRAVGDLHFQVERFTGNEPFVFTVEAWKDGAWQLAACMDNDKRTGTLHTIPFANNALTTNRLRFRCTAHEGAILCDANSGDIDLKAFFND